MIRAAALSLLALLSCGQPMRRGERPPQDPRSEAPPSRPSGPSSAGTLSFGAIADCQSADQPDNGERHYRAAAGKLQEAVRAINAEHPSFTVHLGDFTDTGWNSFNTVAPLFGALQTPGHHVLGNHDFSVPDAQKAAVPERLGIPERYRAFSENGWRFISLDGNDVSLHAWPNGSAAQLSAREFRDQHAPGAPDWDGGLGFVQLLWLDTMLNEADAAGESAVVLCHFPVLPASEHVLWNADEVLSILRSHASVKLFLAGHNHAGDYVESGGIHFLTLRAMLDTSQNAWSLIHLAPKEIRVDGSGREPDRVLAIR